VPGKVADETGQGVQEGEGVVEGETLVVGVEEGETLVVGVEEGETLVVGMLEGETLIVGVVEDETLVEGMLEGETLGVGVKDGSISLNQTPFSLAPPPPEVKAVHVFNVVVDKTPACIPVQPAAHDSIWKMLPPGVYQPADKKLDHPGVSAPQILGSELGQLYG
jgi:hypothetical protein